MSTAPNETNYTIEGSGPNLVLIHGMGLNQDMWQWMMPDLVTRFRVIRYDLLGHGGSAKPPEDCALLDLVGQLDRLLEALDISQTAIAGFSLGGTLALAYGVEHPDRTTAITVLNSSYRRDPAQREAMLGRLTLSQDSGPAGTVDAAIERWFTAEFLTSGKSVTDQVRAWMLSNEPQDYATLYRVLAIGDDAPVSDGRSLADAIGDITCPALIVSATDDANNTPAMAELMAREIPNGQVSIIPRLRHMGLAEEPHTFSAKLIQFLDGL